MISLKNYSVPCDALAWLEGITFVFKGEQLSAADTRLMKAGIRYQYALLHDLSLDSEVDTYRRWLASTSVLDVFHFGKFLGVVDSGIKTYPAAYERGERIQNYTEFKQQCECKGYWGFIAPIKNVISTFLLCPAPGEMKVISQWINFLRRLNLRDIDLSTDMAEEYLAFEQGMAEWEYPETDLRDLRKIVQGWMKDFHIDPESFRPKHGPGSIAGYKGRLPIPAKYALMKTDVRLSYLSKYIGDVQSWTPFGLKEGLERCSEIVFVPKSMITNRVISKEPCSLQYFQQGVMNELMEYIHHHPYLRRAIDFRDQAKSARLAWEGSLFGEYSTIDLSAASDSVSYTLVKRLFSGSPIYPWLVTTRSDETRLPDGTRVRLRKFAPMGSALCFPVETLVFAAICELAKERTEAKVIYRVFGDDIIISRDAEAVLIDLLKAFHFTPNATKSFGETSLLNFREACGGEFFNGEDITPLRISRQFSVPDRLDVSSADRIQSYISFANEAFDFGFLYVRKMILEDLQRLSPKWLYNQLPYSEDGALGIKTFPSSATNFRLASRFNLKYYRKEYSALYPTSKPSCDCSTCPVFDLDDVICRDCEVARYFERMRSRQGSEDAPPEAPEQTNVCPSSSKLRRGWVALDI